MINEAKRLLAEDSYRLVRAVEKGKLGPEVIGPHVLFQIGNRIIRTLPSPTGALLVKRAIDTKAGSARTHSELFGFRLTNLVMTTIGKLDPEEQRGVLFYVAGDDRQHGLAVVALELISESSSVDVTERLVTWRAQYLRRLDEQDVIARSAVDGLPPPFKRLAHGALHEAALSLSVGDQRTAMLWLRQVRMFVSTYGRPR